MKLLLLFLSLFTFIFSKDKEVENEMANGYSVYFAMNEGWPQYSTVNDVLEIPDLDDYVPYKSPTSEYSYEFGGWYIDDECTAQALTGDPITGNIILHALWIETQIGGYSITFVANGGTPEPDNLTYQTAIPDPLPSISKAGFTFAGWRWGNTLQNVLVTPGEPIYADATIYAMFTKVGFTIAYDSNGGSAVSQTTGVNAFPSPLPTTTKAGSTFGGWWNSNFTAQYTAGQPIYGSLIAYAKWIVNSYTVTWVENGGTPAPDDLTDVASLPSPLPIITKTGYEPDGWYFNSLFTGSAATPGQLITQNETLYAKFVRVLYVIGYELDGGTNNLGNPDEYNVESPTITLLNPSKVGYTFDGWFSDAEKTTAITSIPTGTTGDITIYALFTLSETGYSIAWVENGGTPEQTDLTNQNYLPSVLPALYKANYIFKGWYKDEVLTIAAAPSAIIGENTTLYAKFEAQSTPKKGYIIVEPIDTTLNATSKKPLQNKAIYSELSYKVDKVADKSLVLDTEIAHLVALDTQAELDIKFGAKEDIANKGVANGYAPLNASGIIDATYVPSAYTDYIEYATYADLPATGDEGTLYVVIADETSGDNTSTYRWTGSVYVNVTDKLSASEVKALYESNADTNAYTDEEKTRLTGIEALAEVNIVEGVKVDSVLLTPDVDRIVNVDLSGKVDKVEGKALSTNDYTDEEKSLVASISLKNGEQDKQIATIEENLRRVNNGEVNATVVGERVIYLGKDVANAPLKIETEGLLLDAPQLVTNGDMDSTTGWDLSNMTITGGELLASDVSLPFYARSDIGEFASTDKFYVIIKSKNITDGNYTLTLRNVLTTVSNMIISSNTTTYTLLSGLLTATGTGSKLVIGKTGSPASGSLYIDYTYVFNISTLISNKQYSPLYSTTFDLMSDAEIKAQMDLWVANGTLPNDIMSVDFNKRFTSVGKNLFDNSYIVSGSYFNISGGLSTDGTSEYSTQYIKVKPNTTYVVNKTTFIIEYDNDKTFIRRTIPNISTIAYFTTQSNTMYLRISQYQFGLGQLALFQLELGSTATTYEPFAKSEMYIAPNVKGYRLPNGVYDSIEYKNGKYYYIQRVKKYTLQASDISNISTEPINFDRVTILKSIDMVGFEFMSTGNHKLDGYDVAIGYSTDYDSLDNVNKTIATTFLSVKNVYLLVPKGTYANLAAAKAALAGTDIYYQLATPIETEIDADGVLNGYENGTVYVENAVKDMAIYNSGFTITNDDYLISELETIIKIDKITGLQTVYSASTAVVAGDKLSFTHSSLANGDLVFITYKYLSPLMSNTNITFIDNKQVVLGTGSSAGKYFKITPSVVDGAIVWVATEV